MGGPTYCCARSTNCVGIAVVGIGHHDHRELVGGPDTEQGAVPRQRAAMAKSGLAARALDAEAEPPARLPVRLQPVNSLHLAQVLPRRICAAARGPVAELQHREAREVGHGGGHVGGGGDAARVSRGRRTAAVGHAGGHSGGPGAGRRGRARPTRCSFIPSGSQDVARHVSGIGLAGHGLHHVAGQGEGEVRVLPLGLGGDDTCLAGEALAEALHRRKVEVGPVGEGGLARQPGRMGERWRMVTGGASADLLGTANHGKWRVRDRRAGAGPRRGAGGWRWR